MGASWIAAATSRSFHRLLLLAKYRAPNIFNTDQGSQFTSTAFTGVLEQAFAGNCLA